MSTLTVLSGIAWAVAIGAAVGLVIAIIIIWKLEDKAMEKRKKFGNPKNDDVRNFK